MKKLISLTLVVLMLCSMATFAFAASADATAAADTLYALGLFSGTGKDAEGNPIYDLDRIPTRAEAVTMLVRLLGKDETVTMGGKLVNAGAVSADKLKETGIPEKVEIVVPEQPAETVVLKLPRTPVVGRTLKVFRDGEFIQGELDCITDITYTVESGWVTVAVTMHRDGSVSRTEDAMMSTLDPEAHVAVFDSKGTLVQQFDIRGGADYYGETVTAEYGFRLEKGEYTLKLMDKMTYFPVGARMYTEYTEIG